MDTSVGPLNTRPRRRWNDAMAPMWGHPACMGNPQHVDADPGLGIAPERGRVLPLAGIYRSAYDAARLQGGA